VLQTQLECCCLVFKKHIYAVLTSRHRQSSGFFCSPQRPLQGQVPLQQMYLQMAWQTGVVALAVIFFAAV
jgi:hypothetical protein